MHCKKEKQNITEIKYDSSLQFSSLNTRIKCKIFIFIRLYWWLNDCWTAYISIISVTNEYVQKQQLILTDVNSCNCHLCCQPDFIKILHNNLKFKFMISKLADKSRKRQRNAWHDISSWRLQCLFHPQSKNYPITLIFITWLATVNDAG